MSLGCEPLAAREAMFDNRSQDTPDRVVVISGTCRCDADYGCTGSQLRRRHHLQRPLCLLPISLVLGDTVRISHQAFHDFHRLRPHPRHPVDRHHSVRLQGRARRRQRRPECRRRIALGLTMTKEALAMLGENSQLVPATVFRVSVRRPLTSEESQVLSSSFAVAKHQFGHGGSMVGKATS